MVQSVYAYRIFKLSESKPLYVGIMLVRSFSVCPVAMFLNRRFPASKLSFIQFGGSLAAAYQAKKAGIITGILGTSVSRITVGVSIHIFPDRYS